VDVLRVHLARETHGTIAFPSPRGKWLREGPVNRELKAMCAIAGAPAITMYDLRHTAVTLFATVGVHLNAASDLAGHATTKMTSDVYTHISAPLHRDAVETVAAAVLGDP